MAIGPDGRTAASASWDRTLRVWDLETGRQIARFTAEADIWCCAVAPDGVTVVAGDGSSRVHLLRLEGLSSAGRPAVGAKITLLGDERVG